jgi:ubiquinone/menaquinone biosynthesis C-methylase UbiE
MAHIQTAIDHYFTAATSYWGQVYVDKGLVGTVYQARQQAALKWILRLQLPADTRVLDLGCGAGGTAIRLAQLGYKAIAVDRVQTMLDQVMHNAARAGVNSRVECGLNDASDLKLPTGSCDAAIALGLLPWLSTPKLVLSEIVRVLKPGGYVIISADNSFRLRHLLDPLDNPLLAPARRKAGQVLRSFRLLRPKPGVMVRMYSPRDFKRLIRSSGLQIADHTSVGFGPFSLFRNHLFSEATGLKLNNYLQALSNRKCPLISAIGDHYLILARKPL